MKRVAVVVLLLVLVSAFAPGPASAFASVVTEVRAIEDDKVLAPAVFPFDFGNQPLGNISAIAFTICFRQRSSTLVASTTAIGCSRAASPTCAR